MYIINIYNSIALVVQYDSTVPVSSVNRKVGLRPCERAKDVDFGFASFHPLLSDSAGCVRLRQLVVLVVPPMVALENNGYGIIANRFDSGVTQCSHDIILPWVWGEMNTGQHGL